MHRALTASLPQAARQLLPLTESAGARTALIAIALAFLLLFLLLPLIVVFAEALRLGFGSYWAAIGEPEALAAIRLTLLTALTVVPLNAIFAIPGVIIATLFVTLPFVARELIPLMQKQGTDYEEAALMLGANGWQTLFRVTLPNIKWGLLYGLLLCNGRAIGEFGAVAVVSGHIVGLTTTMPLYIEVLYNDFNFAAAFAVASLLTLIAFATLILRAILEWRADWQLARSRLH